MINVLSIPTRRARAVAQVAPQRIVRGRRGSNCEPASTTLPLVVREIRSARATQRRHSSNRCRQHAIDLYVLMQGRRGSNRAAVGSSTDGVIADIDWLAVEAQAIRRLDRHSLR